MNKTLFSSGVMNGFSYQIGPVFTNDVPVSVNTPNGPLRKTTSSVEDAKRWVESVTSRFVQSVREQ